VNETNFLNRATIGTQITTTSETTCYSVASPQKWAHVSSIRAINKDTTGRSITVSWVDAAPTTTTFRLMYATPIQAGAHAVIDFPDGLVLRTGDQIRATADTSNAFDLLVTVIESTGQSG
jgi:hypothetical protein